jgi:hypothetical protein
MRDLIIFFVGLAYDVWQAYEKEMDAKEIANLAADRTRVEVERRLAHDRFELRLKGKL